MTIPSFEEYLDSLSNLATVNDPTLLSAEGAALKVAANAIGVLPDVSASRLAALIREHPEYVPALGLAVGLSKEGLRNTLRHHLGTAGHVMLAREDPTWSAHWSPSGRRSPGHRSTSAAPSSTSPS